MSLTVLAKINAHKVQAASAAVGEYVRQSDRIQETLSRLELYRLEYSALNTTQTAEHPVIYADQQLFLQRMDDNIVALRDQYVEIQRLLQVARKTLKMALEEGEVLTSAITRRAERVDKEIQLRIQKECDETGRIINKHSLRRNTLH